MTGPSAHFSKTAIRAWVAAEIAPFATDWDRTSDMPRELLLRLAAQQYLAAMLPVQFGGAGIDALTMALLHEEIGKGCSSVRSLLTVHEMVAHVIGRWGDNAAKAFWLPKLASGETLAAFALSEADAGNDAAAIRTRATTDGQWLCLNGSKKWITFGQLANVFLVFAETDGGSIAVLVTRDAPGLTVTAVNGMSGARASMLAELDLSDCRVPLSSRVGGPGFGLAIALSALELGRLSVAAGSAGIIAACLDATVAHARERVQFGKPIGEQQLVRRMIADMATDLRASVQLCQHAASSWDANDANAQHEIIIAKYFASRAAVRAAASAVQIHGANGCSDHHPVNRYSRDARVMEIIEGSTQLLQDLIGATEIDAFGS